jgi:hypothetical protein
VETLRHHVGHKNRHHEPNGSNPCAKNQTFALSHGLTLDKANKKSYFLPQSLTVTSLMLDDGENTKRRTIANEYHPP